MADIENVEHFELLNHIKETLRIIAIYKSSGRIDSILKIAEMIKHEIDTLNELMLPKRNHLLATLKINEAIILFNSMELKQLE